MKYLFLLMFLAACGTDDESKDKTDVEGKKKDDQPSEKYQETPHALAADALPKCDKDNRKQLVYVIPDKHFYTCEDDGWQEFQIVVDQKPQLSILWQDPVTNRYWHILGIYLNSNMVCPDSGAARVWEISVPEQAIKDVIDHGIFGDTTVKVWVKDGSFVYSNNTAFEYSRYDQPSQSAQAFLLCELLK